MSFNLGQSDQIIKINIEDLVNADLKMNQFIFDSICQAGQGLAVGLLASLLFKKKTRIITFCTGFGVGNAVHQHYSQLFNKWFEPSN